MNGLVANLMNKGYKLSPATVETLTFVDRTYYCPYGSPYNDSPQHIGFGATISAPHMHAVALECLYPYFARQNCKILDVGSGSGYLTACFAYLAKQHNGHVYGVEHVPELVERSRQSIAQSNAELLDYITLSVSDGYEGLEKHSPFSCIHVGASCTKIPEKLWMQLDDDGAILMPFESPSGEQQMTLITRDGSRHPVIRELFPVRYISLTSLENQISSSSICRS